MKRFVIALALAAVALVGCGKKEEAIPTQAPVAAAPAAAPAPVVVNNAAPQASHSDWLLPALGGLMVGNMLSGSSRQAAPTVNHTTVVNKTVNVVRPPVPSTSPSSYRAPSYSAPRSSSFSSSRSSFSSGSFGRRR